MTTNAEQAAVRTALVAALCAVAGCGAPHPEKVEEMPYLGLERTFKEHLNQLGCKLTTDYFTHFECVWELRPCGCNLVVNALTDADENAEHRRLTLARADIIGCPADTGLAEALSAFEPLMPESAKERFIELVRAPRLERNTDDQARFAVFQTAAFEGIHAKAFFGVTTETPRRTIWLDRYTPPGVQKLVPDAPAYGRCRTGEEPRDATLIPFGYCDEMSNAAPPCDRPDGRSSNRWQVSAWLSSASGGWNGAIRSVDVAAKIRDGRIAFDTRLGDRLASTLFDSLGERVALIPESGNTEASGRVLRARQLAEQVAATMTPPTDRAALVAYIGTMADEWLASLRSQLYLLADKDLEALGRTLQPRIEEMLPSVYSAKIEKCITR